MQAHFFMYKCVYTTPLCPQPVYTLYMCICDMHTYVYIYIYIYVCTAWTHSSAEQASPWSVALALLSGVLDDEGGNDPSEPGPRVPTPRGCKDLANKNDLARPRPTGGLCGAWPPQPPSFMLVNYLSAWQGRTVATGGPFSFRARELAGGGLFDVQSCPLCRSARGARGLALRSGMRVAGMASMAGWPGHGLRSPELGELQSSL